MLQGIQEGRGRTVSAHGTGGTIWRNVRFSKLSNVSGRPHFNIARPCYICPLWGPTFWVPRSSRAASVHRRLEHSAHPMGEQVILPPSIEDVPPPGLALVEELDKLLLVQAGCPQA